MRRSTVVHTLITGNTVTCQAGAENHFQRKVPTLTDRDLQAYKIWLRNKMGVFAAGQYYGTVEKMVQDMHKPASKITLSDLTIYIDKLYKQYSPQTVNIYGYRIKSFLKFIEKDSLAYKLPIRKVIPGPDDVVEEKIQWIPEDKIRYLIDSAQSQTDMVAIQLGYHFAMRVGEIQLLKGDMLDRKERTLKFYRLKSRDPWQTLPCDHEDTGIHDTYQVLAPYVYANGDGYMFPSRTSKNGYLSKVAFEEIIKRTVDNAAKKDTYFAELADQGVSWHILRHSKSTNIMINQLKNNRVRLVFATKWLHHSSYDTTLVYAHIAAKFLGITDVTSLM